VLATSRPELTIVRVLTIISLSSSDTSGMVMRRTRMARSSDSAPEKALNIFFKLYLKLEANSWFD
jgi:hypothetical protein